MKKEIIGTVYVVISALGFGLMAIFAKVAYGEGLNVNTLLFLRFLLATLLLWGLVFYKKLPYKLPKRDVIFLFLMGMIGYTAQSKFFFTSLETISASLAALLLYAYPAIVTIISFLFHVEKLTLQKNLALLISGIGLLMVLGISDVSFHIKGAGFALSAAFVYSFYILAGNGISKRVDPLVMSAFITSAAAYSFIVLNLMEGTFSFQITWKGMGATASIAIFSTVIAIYTFFLGLERLGPSKASIISTFEPVFTILIATIFFQETLTFTQLIGGALILLSVLFLQMKTKQQPIEPPSTQPLQRQP